MGLLFEGFVDEGHIGPDYLPEPSGNNWKIPGDELPTSNKAATIRKETRSSYSLTCSSAAWKKVALGIQRVQTRWPEIRVIKSAGATPQRAPVRGPRSCRQLSCTVS